MLAAEFTEGWNIVVTATAGILGACVGGGLTVWGTTRAETVRRKEARSARLYERRADTYRVLARRIQAFRGAVLAYHLAQSPRPVGDRASATKEMVNVYIADQDLRSSLLEVRLVASRNVRQKAIALRDQLSSEIDAVKPAETESGVPLPGELDKYQVAFNQSWERTEAGQEDLLEAISDELDLDP